MVHKEMQQWICIYTFNTFMDSNADKMALELKVSDRILNRALRREDSPEGRLVFELCIRYFIDNGIDINAIFMTFFSDDQ